MHKAFIFCRRAVLPVLILGIMAATLSGCFTFSLPTLGNTDKEEGNSSLFNPDGDDDPRVPSTQEQTIPTEQTTHPTEPATRPTEAPTEPPQPTTEPTEPPTEPTTAPTQPPIEADPIGYGIVLGDVVNLRSGPGTGFDVEGTVTRNTRIAIYARSGNWGQTEKGWISLDYVYMDGTVGPNGSVMGTVKGTDVNIRSGPGTKYGIVGKVNTGDRLEILHRVKIGNMTWGCTSRGWVCMDYVVVDGEAAD